MNHEIAGTTVTAKIDFAPAGPPLIADQNSVSYTVRGNDGAPISGLVDIPVATNPGAQSVSVMVAGADNALSGGRRFETRTIVVSFASQAKPYRVTHRYTLIPWLNTTVTPDDVRGFIGINRDELPDRDINIFAAYLGVENRLSQVTLEGALAAGNLTALKANDAIKFQAVLDLIPGLQLRIAKSETNGTVGYQRLSAIDFGMLRAEASSRLGTILGELGGGSFDPLASYPLMVATSPADAITGA